MLPADLFLCGSVTVLKEATALFIVVFIFNHSVEMKKIVSLHVLYINVLMHKAVVNERLQFRDKKHRNTGSLGPRLTWVW